MRGDLDDREGVEDQLQLAHVPLQPERPGRLVAEPQVQDHRLPMKNGVNANVTGAVEGKSFGQYIDACSVASTRSVIAQEGWAFEQNDGRFNSTLAAICSGASRAC